MQFLSDDNYQLNNTVRRLDTRPYKCTKHASPGFYLFFLLFGRSPGLPVDLIFNTKPTAGQNSTEKYLEYTQKWCKAIAEAYQLASK